MTESLPLLHLNSRTRSNHLVGDPCDLTRPPGLTVQGSAVPGSAVPGSAVPVSAVPGSAVPGWAGRGPLGSEVQHSEALSLKVL